MFTEIAENLFVSGVEDVRGWVEKHPEGVCVSCCSELAQLQFIFEVPVEEMSHRGQVLAKRAGRVVSHHRKFRPVLVFCPDGGERSCLVAALALIDDGCARSEALQRVRDARGPGLASGMALTNKYFVELIEVSTTW